MPKTRKTKPVTIDTPYPTFEEMRKLYRLSKKDALSVKRIVWKVILGKIVKKYGISRKDSRTLERLAEFIQTTE